MDTENRLRCATVNSAQALFPLHLVSDCLQLSDQSLGLRLPFDRELGRSGLAAGVREARKVERLRTSLSSGGSVAGGEPPELDQPGPALVEYGWRRFEGNLRRLAGSRHGVDPAAGRSLYAPNPFEERGPLWRNW